MQCDCQSYNRPDWGGTEPESVLPPPAWSKKTGICVDSCIAEVIQHLWDHGIVTAACCCGHNAFPPVVFIANGQSIGEVQELIERVDDRRWEVKFVDK